MGTSYEVKRNVLGCSSFNYGRLLARKKSMFRCYAVSLLTSAACMTRLLTSEIGLEASIA